MTDPYFRWLSKEPAPRHLVQAMKLYGTEEIVGPKHNPEILQWAKETGLRQYTNDEIPWCGLYVAVVMKRANREVVKDPLWARNWVNFGVPSPSPMLGDVLVFSRGSGGHVGFYVGEDNDTFHVLGGNQNNRVNVTRILKSRLLACRRPPYHTPPLNIRKIELDSQGSISVNEA